MYLVGDVPLKARRLVDVTYECLMIGIDKVKPGARLGDIGAAIQAHAEQHRYGVVREFCGHGIGQEMHEEPQVLHYGRRGDGLELEEGRTFTIEPMINQGRAAIDMSDDGWTVTTRDGKLSAQAEHTVLVTADGVEVLTLRADERVVR
jgi:methionyl aminopeptidase